MTSKKSTQRHFPYQCQTKANTVKRGKSIERNFVIDFTSKQSMDQSSASDISIKDKVINENITNENRYINAANKTIDDDLDVRYRNFRKDRLNYKNYLMSTDSSLTSSLYSPSISTSASSRSASVKNKPQIPTLPEKVKSQKNRNSKRIENNRNHSKYQKGTSRSSHKTRTREVYLSENYYDSEYDNSLDYLISDYDDYQNSDYDYDSYSEIPLENNKKGKIRFVNGNSNLYNISEISEFNNQSEVKSHKSQHHHRHKQSKQKANLAQSQNPNKQIQSRPNQKSVKINQKQNKIVFQPKFCMTEDLTESFLDDLTDHPRKADEEEECNEKIKRLLNDITSEINRVQSRSRLQLKISNPIHIFVNNPTIQRIKGRIPSSDVYMHVPKFESEDAHSVSQMSYDDNDLTISAISFNNYGSPSPIKVKDNQTAKANAQIKRIEVPNADSEEINNSIDSVNKEYIKKIKSRNANYQQILNSQNEKQKLVIKRNKNQSSSKEQSVQPTNEAKINPNRLTINSNNTKNQNSSTKKPLNESNTKSQNFNPGQTKKMIQSLFSNQNNEEATKQSVNDSNPILQISRTSPISSNNTNTVKTDQSKKYPMNASVQNFIKQNDQIIEDLQELKDGKQSSLEAINLIPHLTSSLLTNNSNQKEAEAKDTNKQNSDLEMLNTKTISNISTINKASNIASDQTEDQASNTNDLLSDSYDDTLSTGQKPNPNSISNINQSQNKISQDILFDEETTYNTTMSSFIDQSNIADEIILSEIRGYFDESSSRGETHKVIKPNNNNANTKNNNKEEANNKSFSSLNNDDFLED